MFPSSMPPKDSEGVTDCTVPVFYRMADLVRITGLSRATLYRRIDEGRFPPQCTWADAPAVGGASALQAWIDDPEGYAALRNECLERRL